MICYLDRGFCSRSDTCANLDCPRNLTPEESARAQSLDLPVAYSDFWSPTCGYAPLAQAGARHMMPTLFSLGRKREPLLSKRPTHGSAARTNRDWCRKDAALELADRIREYWSERGGSVEMKVLDLGFFANGRGGVTAIRSNMVNGLPGEKP